MGTMEIKELRPWRCPPGSLFLISQPQRDNLIGMGDGPGLLQTGAKAPIRFLFFLHTLLSPRKVGIAL